MIESRIGPLVAAGILLGAGMGGFVDGIVFHQILQLHNMLSGIIPPDNIVTAKVNMFWDGIFHAGVWVMTAVGLFLLFKAGRRADVAWSGRILLGAMLAGWGLFNSVEGVIDHQLLGLHHVMEYAPNHLPADLAFIASGLILIAIGARLIKSDKPTKYCNQKSTP
jgi:uncharacterized membrane protein